MTKGWLHRTMPDLQYGRSNFSAKRRMKPYSLISDNENGGETFHADECSGLIQCTPEDYVFVDGFPITFRNLSGEHGGTKLPLNDVFKLVKNINSKAVEIGYVKCTRLLLEQNDEQVYLASLLNIDIQKIHLLECFIKNATISFRELDQSHASAWLSACVTLHFSFKNETHFSNAITLDVDSLRNRDEFYCYMGEAFFGYAGYAGRDLDGCREILQSASAERNIAITVRDTEKTKAFLADVTGSADYYDLFKAMIEDLGGTINTPS